MASHAETNDAPRPGHQAAVPPAPSQRERRALVATWWLLWLASVALLAFYVRGPDGERITPTHAQYLFFTLCILSFVPLSSLLGRELVRRLAPAGATLGALLVFALALSALTGMDPYGGIRLLAILVVTSTPFLFLGAALSTAPLSVIVAPLIFSALVSAIGAVVLDVIGPIALGGYLFENFHFSEHPLRWAFLYQEANGLGWALALGIGACLAAAAASTRTPLRAVIVVGVFPFLVWVLLKTNSRASAAWVLFYLMGYALYAIYTVTQRRKIRWSWLAIITVAVVSFFSFSIAWNWSQISAYLRLDETDLTTGRLKIWLLYLNIFAEHPLLGAGFGTTSLLTLGETPKSPLNVLFGMLGETGLVGTALFLALWAGAIRRSWQKLRMQARDSDLRNQVNLFAVLSLVGLVIHQQGEWNLLRIAPINFLFFFLVGVAWSKSATQIDKQG